MTTQIETTAKSIICLSGISGKYWTKNGIHRIYVSNTAKDTNAYLDLTVEGEEVTGSKLCVFINCNQSPKWLANRKAEQMDRYKDLALAALVIVHQGEEINQDSTDDVDRAILEARQYFINESQLV